MTIALLDQIHVYGGRRTPVVEAAEAAECGLACLVMVARYYGHNVDLNGLRQRMTVSMQGLTLRGLMTMAGQMCLAPRALKVEMEDLSKLKLPAILHWNLNHFVVLTKLSNAGAVIHDPACGRRIMQTTELSKYFTGVALELSPTQDFKPWEARSPVRIQQLWSGMSGFQRTLFEMFVLSITLQIVTFAAPFQMQLVVDQAISHSDQDLLAVIALGFGGLVALQCGIQFLRDRVILIAGSLLGFQVVGNLVRHLIRLPSDFFEKRHLGDILSRIHSSEPIRSAITQGLVGAIIDGVMSLVAVIIMFLYSGILTGVVLFSIVLYLGVIAAVYPTMRSRSLEQILASAKEQTNLMETLRAAVTIKIMGREIEREAVWRNMYAGVINSSLSVGNLQITTAAIQNIIGGLQTVIVIYLGATYVVQGGGFSVGMLFAFLSFRQTYTERMASLTNQLMQFRLLGLHLERLGDIINAKPDVSEEASVALDVKGGIEAKNLTFRYGAADAPILHKCSLSVAPGEFVAITGMSGCGKSTLLKLLLGLYQPDAGQILLDGYVATPSIWRSWRSQIGVVAQDDRLLSGSIADNIAFFDPDMHMGRVTAAAQAARVHDDILRMPMQYLSLIGDMGSALSGGQRQRILLARALYREPKVLILDEGTANLDEKTELEIANLISTLPITRIVVAHRPALLRAAHRTYRLEDGSIVARSNQQP
ncbi:ATP-binding cassette subfamily B protein RaxB [Rhizomicrobium palustre]|uniref:ATP-binding cassette subfamily B protein RaxB n=1 Tax=Rhizomicrobium palustre TaxID=189966 RepID=A0A846N5D1_9PROT|nr:peptidase domain-containing ABC transporter [Rhizomicrobium palustre]NIK90257.1 ATP-binding cassette subfamily B protein RaxB [Rhizomicrobium palustre]